MSRIIDLTLPLAQGMRGVNLEPSCTVEEEGWNATMLHLYSHAGTHMDAPTHFGVGETSIDQIEPDRFMGPAWIAEIAGVNSKSLIQIKDLGVTADKVQPGESLILRTGWSHYVHEPRYRDELPRVSLELAQWCVERKINFLGVEPPSVADVHNLEEVTRVHQTLLVGNVLPVEGLSNLHSIQQERITLIIMPLKITGGDGSPVRALAVESKVKDLF